MPDCAPHSGFAQGKLGRAYLPIRQVTDQCNPRFLRFNASTL